MKGMGKGFKGEEPIDPEDLITVEPNQLARKALLGSFGVEAALGIGWFGVFGFGGYALRTGCGDVVGLGAAGAVLAGGFWWKEWETMFMNLLVLEAAVGLAKAIVLDWGQASYVSIVSLVVFILLTLLQLFTTRPALGGQRKKLPTSHVITRLLKPYFLPKGRANKLRALATYACLIAGKVVNLRVPLQIGYIVSDVTSGTMPYTTVWHYIVLVLLVRLLREAQSLLYVEVKQAAYVEMSEGLFKHLHSLSLEWHLRKKIGNVVRSMDRGTQAANTVVESLFVSLIPTLVECVVTFVIFYQHFGQPELAAVCVLSFALYMLVTYSMTLLRKRIREKFNEFDNDFHAQATESLVNFETVKYFTAEERERMAYVSSVKSCQKCGVSIQATSSGMMLSQQLVIYACTGLCMLIAASQILQDPPKLDIGDFVAINAYISQLFAPLSFLGSIYGTVISALVNMKHLADILTEKPDVTDVEGASPISLPRDSMPGVSVADVMTPLPRATTTPPKPSNGGTSWKGSKPRGALASAWFPSVFSKKTEDKYATLVEGAVEDKHVIDMEPVSRALVGEKKATRGVDVEFRNVGFKYPSADAGVGVKDISFKVEAGKKLALVGQTGCGKTTLSRLLFRFYDPVSGGVYVNGQNIAHVQQSSLRRAIGIVPQDTVLFNDTIRNNVLYGRPSATAEELEQVAKDAKLDAVIKKLPEGWNTIVGERGLRLSGGEKQRVAIARCLLKDPPIIVLDEATSALDSTTEKEILDVLQCLEGRTLVVIAHRLSTIQDSDLILVLKDGGISEAGTHETLLQDPAGVYSEMWRNQENRERRLTPPTPAEAHPATVDHMKGNPRRGKGGKGAKEGKPPSFLEEPEF